MGTVPTCPRCGTDAHLEILDFEEGFHEDYNIPAHGGSIKRTRWHAPVATFKCSQCGYFNGYSTPDDWTPASINRQA